MSIDYDDLREMVQILDNPAAHDRADVYDAVDDLETRAPNMARELLRVHDEPASTKDMQLPPPARTPGDDTNWTEWDAAREWFTVAVTDNNNVALIDNTDPDAAAFLAPEEAEELAHGLLAAARETNARITRDMAKDTDTFVHE